MKFLTALFLLILSSVISANTLNKIVVFGDSVSDNGNLYRLMGHMVPLSPPYFKGRFSNGPIWIESLLKYYYPTNSKKHLLDYAVGGAAVGDGTEDNSLFTLNNEVDTYLASHEGKADPNSLFIIWIGGNNYLLVPEDKPAAVNTVAKGLRAEVERLVSKGATNILIINLPDVGKSPAAREYEIETPLSELVQMHNEAILNEFRELQLKHHNVNWMLFDAFSLAKDILERPSFYNFSNTQDTCIQWPLGDFKQKNFFKMAGAPIKSLGRDNCTGYLFFDPIHLTTLAHDIIAKDLYIFLTTNGVEFEKSA